MATSIKEVVPSAHNSGLAYLQNLAAKLFEEWRPALIWGISASFIQRIAFVIWMGVVWTLVGIPNKLSIDKFNIPPANLPILHSRLEELVFGVWRRWDVVHFMNLAMHGYRASDPIPSTFAPTTPVMLALLNIILPSGIDLAALAFGLLSTTLLFTMTYRFVEVYWKNSRLAQWSVIVTAILPASFFFAAAMSDGIYLAMVMAMFYAAFRKRWWLTAVFGTIATLARLQAVALPALFGLMILRDQLDQPIPWSKRIVNTIVNGLPFLLLPAVYFGFIAYRAYIGLPSINELYVGDWNSKHVFPLLGLYYNLSYYFRVAGPKVIQPDIFLDAGYLILLIVQLFNQKHRKFEFLLYCWGYYLLFISRVQYDDHGVMGFGISSGRHILCLFPLHIMLADMLRTAPRVIRLGAVALLLCAALLLSGVFALGFGIH